MASMASNSHLGIPAADLQSFREHLHKSNRILAVLGAGLSASSGLPTFRGAGGLWRTHDATSLATPEAFARDPGLVWQFYNYRRHMALKAKPNKAHYALAELARKKDNFITISQNVDGLSPRANHPPEKLKLLHGSLFDLKCSEFFCNYSEQNNYTDPVVPALTIPTDESDPTTNDARHKTEILQEVARDLDISDENVPLPELAILDLPHCPQCKTGLLRPGVVWFGEMLPPGMLEYVDEWIREGVDLVMVIGTSSKVYPAAGFADEARESGARVAVINMDAADLPKTGLSDEDWLFQGDAAQIVPELLKDIIGEIREIREDGTVISS